jgi:hypothetical protein
VEDLVASQQIATRYVFNNGFVMFSQALTFLALTVACCPGAAPSWPNMVASLGPENSVSKSEIRAYRPKTPTLDCQIIDLVDSRAGATKYENH